MRNRPLVVKPLWFGWLVAMTLVTVLFAGATHAAAASAKGTDYYVSVGDSYGAGYQPIASAQHGKDSHGFAYQVPPLARAKGHHLVLRNFACDGATTATVIQQKGCGLVAPGPDSVSYPNQTQASAADAFLVAHRGRIGLITVSLGGNDILGCTAASIMVACVTNALVGVRSHLATLLSGLRQAAGPDVPIIGLTYPDVFLGLLTSKDSSQQSLADLSVPVFQDQLNPALEAAYSAVGASFIDVTKATGAYTPLSQTTATARYGTIPVAVAEVCQLTYYCALQDVHPTNAGYLVIARLIVAALPRPTSQIGD